jgi:hypothetical protein
MRACDYESTCTDSTLRLDGVSRIPLMAKRRKNEEIKRIASEMPLGTE